MRKLIVGNWKMNGSVEDARRLIAEVVNKIHQTPRVYDECEFVVCPPFLHISAIKHSLTGLYSISYGAQDCSAYENGAYTGDVSAEMLRDYGCSYVILGHSERRQYHGETNETIAQKVARAHEQGIMTIICVGETEAQRDAGQQESVVGSQLEKVLIDSVTTDNTIIAYEPVWAIGTGKSAEPNDIKEMHAFIRGKLENKYQTGAEMRILYGGSVNPGNAEFILQTPNVDGGLIGGASLKSDDFLAIARCA